MIKTFKCKETQKIYNREFSKKLPHDIQRTAYKKLMMIDASIDIDDLKVPPANRVEKLLEIEMEVIVYVSINSMLSVLYGKMVLHLMLR